MIEQREELHRRIWSIADEVRGSIDGWDFKQYVLGTLFYRFISENFEQYMNGEDDEDGEEIKYNEIADEEIDDEIREDAIKTLGYFIYPSQLFANFVKNCESNENLNIELKEIFNEIEASARGYESESKIAGLFGDFDTSSKRLGKTTKERNIRLCKILRGVEKFDIGDFRESKIDIFGDAYEFLISNYASNAGKSGGEFFTPPTVSRLLIKLATVGKGEIRTIYDPACGSGSLLLQAKKEGISKLLHFYGQEINHTTYNLARMNMFLHGVNYSSFDIALGDTLVSPEFRDKKPFDIIVSNPPYSIKWVGSDNPLLIMDERYTPAGVLPPKSKADFAFVLHSLNYLSSKGRAVIVSFPGIFYRGGAEKKIRKYLVNYGFIEAIISLAPNLFFGTSIAVNLLVLSKDREDKDILFIDGSSFFKKGTNNNFLGDDDIAEIVKLFSNREDVKYLARKVSISEIEENDYNLSVSAYVEMEDTREKIDIRKLNNSIDKLVKRIEELRRGIDKIVEEIER